MWSTPGLGAARACRAGRPRSQVPGPLRRPRRSGRARAAAGAPRRRGPSTASTAASATVSAPSTTRRPSVCHRRSPTRARACTPASSPTAASPRCSTCACVAATARRSARRASRTSRCTRPWRVRWLTGGAAGMKRGTTGLHAVRLRGVGGRGAPVARGCAPARRRSRRRARRTPRGMLAALRASGLYRSDFLRATGGAGRPRTHRNGYLVLRAENDTGPAARCLHCGACVPVCPTNANREFDGADARLITTDQTACIGCGACVEVCPANKKNGGQTLRVVEAPAMAWLAALATSIGARSAATERWPRDAVSATTIGTAVAGGRRPARSAARGRRRAPATGASSAPVGRPARLHRRSAEPALVTIARRTGRARVPARPRRASTRRSSGRSSAGGAAASSRALRGASRAVPELELTAFDIDKLLKERFRREPLTVGSAWHHGYWRSYFSHAAITHPANDGLREEFSTAWDIVRKQPAVVFREAAGRAPRRCARCASTCR